jgi:hypothetical protein
MLHAGLEPRHTNIMQASDSSSSPGSSHMDLGDECSISTPFLADSSEAPHVPRSSEPTARRRRHRQRAFNRQFRRLVCKKQNLNVYWYSLTFQVGFCYVMLTTSWITINCETLCHAAVSEVRKTLSMTTYSRASPQHHPSELQEGANYRPWV